IPGTFPTRLTTILSLLFPVSTLTALLMVMLSKLIPFTSTSLSPTSRPASSKNNFSCLDRSVWLEVQLLSQGSCCSSPGVIMW
uniref:Uncharacterized protein n=1 Tax=Cynoglossus semilaevis TaxID=244447 RepID=A0A3P8V946_CYNSE